MSSTRDLWHEMGSWNILAPLLKQKFKLPRAMPRRGWLRSTEVFITCNGSFDALDRLRSPASKVPGLGQAWHMGLRSPARSSSLERLPPEILRSILFTLETADQVAVALCSQHLWAYAVPAIHQDVGFRQKEFSWAGTPIICQYINPIVLSQALTDVIPEQDWPDVASPSTPGAVAGTLRHWVVCAIHVSKEVYAPQSHEPVTEFWEHVLRSDIPEGLHSQMASCLDMQAFQSRVIHLRNFTTKEYIRLEVVQQGTRTTAVFAGHDWLTLDILLMWLISWCRNQTDPVREWSDEQETDGSAWDLGEDGVTPDIRTVRRAREMFTSMAGGRWAAHCLDVTDGEMDAGWHDRTPDIEKRSTNWLMATYVMSYIASKYPDKRKHWEYWREIVKKEAERGDGRPGSLTGE